jgi:EmrB/QacA subfamily drug resistance transporter
MNSPAQTARTLSPRDIRFVVVGAMLAMFLAALDQTIVAPALPPIARDLGDFALISWIVTAYLLTATCVTPIIGKLSDLYGRRRVLAACLLIFMASSVLCALAPSMSWLIIGRALQGIGGGGLIPLAHTIIADVVAPRERGRYAGYFSVVWAGAAVLGPVLGGLLTEQYGWPCIFWINLPLCGIGLLIADRALRRLPVEGRRARIDYASSALLMVATAALLTVLSLGGKGRSWFAPEIVGAAVVALALGGLFVRLQARAADPILPPRFLADGVIRPVLAASCLIYGCYLSIVVLTPIYMQVALGRPVSETGLLMIPLILASTVTANYGGRHSQRSGRYKPSLLVGLPVSIVALALLGLLADRLSPWVASVLLMAVGAGLGPTFPASTVAVQNAVDRRDLGTVSGALAFSRALGAAIMVAAASAVVLGLAASALPDAGPASSLEDLARQDLPEAARIAVSHAFGIAFGALGAALLAAFVILARVEERPLGSRAGIDATPAADRAP